MQRVSDVWKCRVFLMIPMEITVSVGSENEVPGLNSWVCRQGPNPLRCFVGSLLYSSFAVSKLNNFFLQYTGFLKSKGYPCRPIAMADPGI